MTRAPGGNDPRKRPAITTASAGDPPCARAARLLLASRSSEEHMSSRRMRVLLIAEAANPEWVSVPLVGWSHARALAERVDAHLVTQVRNRDAIVRAGWREGREFTAIDSERAAARAHKLAEWLRGGPGRGWTIVTALQSLCYRWFERLVWQRFGGAIRGGAYDLV